MTNTVADRVGPFELQVVCALRERGWRAVQLGELTSLLSGRVKRRTVRHHLARLVAVGAVDECRWRDRFLGWRWSADAPGEYVQRCETAARAAGLVLAPVKGPPTACPCGDFVPGSTWADGAVQCLRCLRWL